MPDERPPLKELDECEELLLEREGLLKLRLELLRLEELLLGALKEREGVETLELREEGELKLRDGLLLLLLLPVPTLDPLGREPRSKVLDGV